jgi:hypothetical protein
LQPAIDDCHFSCRRHCHSRVVLQQQLLPELPEAAGFALAGGAALIVTGIVERETDDLDFFGREAAAVNRLAPAFEHAAQRAGMTVARVVDAPGFVRFEVTRGNERCEVDLGYDARLWPLQQTALGPTIGDEELAADKTLALFGRAAARDFVEEARLVELASAKDLGFSPAYLADALGRSIASTGASSTSMTPRTASFASGRCGRVGPSMRRSGS